MSSPRGNLKTYLSSTRLRNIDVYARQLAQCIMAASRHQYRGGCWSVLVLLVLRSGVRRSRANQRRTQRGRRHSKIHARISTVTARRDPAIAVYVCSHPGAKSKSVMGGCVASHNARLRSKRPGLRWRRDQARGSIGVKTNQRAPRAAQSTEVPGRACALPICFWPRVCGCLDHNAVHVVNYLTTTPELPRSPTRALRYS